MNKKKIAALFGIGTLIAGFNLVIGIFMIKILWSNIAETLFPKLIKSGQIITYIPFLDALWIGLLLIIIIRAFAGTLLKVTNKDNSTTVSLGGSYAKVNNKDSKKKKENE